MPAPMKKTLHLQHQGRILDHLGIQRYQSPVSALVELVANVRDADAKHVRISLPKKLDDQADIVIKDDGIGMTFEDCQNFYLNVGGAGELTTPIRRRKAASILGRF